MPTQAVVEVVEDLAKGVAGGNGASVAVGEGAKAVGAGTTQEAEHLDLSGDGTIDSVKRCGVERTWLAEAEADAVETHCGHWIR